MIEEREGVGSRPGPMERRLAKARPKYSVNRFHETEKHNDREGMGPANTPKRDIHKLRRPHCSLRRGPALSLRMRKDVIQW